jgi:hypothetical protein
MGWERGYYYRVRKVDGRVVREYIGTGKMAQLVAKMEALERQRRALERADRQALRDELNALENAVVEVCDKSELLARAALVAAGFRQHKRSEWRKRRGKRQSA